ncbi:MAG: bifunctional 5,10-methylenetetrahydrofolate dehydrogenase/5,10-methenyltetrahydrofolate cyclohydrolase [Flavobacteriales bacterium]|jgi:methylenetetrahydrofolate dehydrogenase (NADP+)/methenyltetrahydrofolate cyclohydrolase|nr:bifunctional 5,10-methylenetetrahydrofolate dehydrogenase/5,10-methenyltetrahydrofolate cyclohydrolase [Flavobacteriales bacterium]
MILLSGTQCSASIKDEIKDTCKTIQEEGKRAPKLIAILVGDDGASRTYVNAKVKACEYVGFASEILRFDANISESELIQEIQKLNQNTSVDGFIVQLPLPKHISEENVTMAIDPSKDVDGFHPQNIGEMVLGMDTFLPATPNGIVELLKRSNIETEGKNCVVVGRSNIVGTPMSILMSRNVLGGNSTVTLTHSRTKNLKQHCQNADILIVALGKAEFIKEDMVKEGAVVIDVGIHRIDDPEAPRGFRLKGDVEFAGVSKKVQAITPVPGGVGPMTIASLLQNTLKAYQKFAN